MSYSRFHLIARVAACAATLVSPVSMAQSSTEAAPSGEAAAPSSAPTGPTAPGGKMYRWVDKNGTTHFSDRPQPGAQSVAVQAPQTYSAPRSTAPVARPAAGPSSAAAPAPSCGITSPTPDEVFPNVQSVMISYRGPTGGTAQLQLSGASPQTLSAPAGQSFTISPIARGTYTARVSITGEAGTPPCVTPPVTFHVRQPSLLAPVRQQMNRTPPRAN